MATLSIAHLTSHHFLCMNSSLRPLSPPLFQHASRCILGGRVVRRLFIIRWFRCLGLPLRSSNHPADASPSLRLAGAFSPAFFPHEKGLCIDHFTTQTPRGSQVDTAHSTAPEGSQGAQTEESSGNTSSSGCAAASCCFLLHSCCSGGCSHDDDDDDDHSLCSGDRCPSQTGAVSFLRTEAHHSSHWLYFTTRAAGCRSRGARHDLSPALFHSSLSSVSHAFCPPLSERAAMGPRKLPRGFVHAACSQPFRSLEWPNEFPRWSRCGGRIRRADSGARSTGGDRVGFEGFRAVCKAGTDG